MRCQVGSEFSVILSATAAIFSADLAGQTRIGVLISLTGPNLSIEFTIAVRKGA